MKLILLFLLPFLAISSRELVVVLHCSFRSGSSFLGELFNNNPDAFYVFEPLTGTKPDQHLQILERVINTCNSRHWGITERTNSFNHPETVFSRCLFNQILAIKTVRIRDISLLRNLTIWDSSTPLRVVHLLRDPRAVLQSRLQYPQLHSRGMVYLMLSISLALIYA